MSDLHDPRVLFAAERTLLAWNRTAVSMMAFGFVVERFGLFLEIIGREEVTVFQRHFSFFVGVAFMLLSSVLAAFSVLQHRRILKTLRPVEIPAGYNVNAGMAFNAILAVLGVLVSVYVSRGFI